MLRLNRAVALSYCGSFREALEAVESLLDSLTKYQPYHAARAELLARSKRTDEAGSGLPDGSRPGGQLARADRPQQNS